MTAFRSQCSARRPVSTGQLLAFLVLLVAVPLHAWAQPAGKGTSSPAPTAATIELPPSMKQYAEVARRLGAFREELQRMQTTVQTVVKFDDPSAFPVVHGNGTVEITREKDRSVLRVTAADQSPCMVRIGPVVSGDFAIEIDCRADSPNLNDLSIILDRLDTGPGFQFGGYGNTRNILIAPVAGADAKTSQTNTIDLPPTPLIQAGKVHTVRLEVSRQTVTASVDGKKLGSAAMGGAYDPAQPRQPLFYVYNSAATVLEVRLLHMRHFRNLDLAEKQRTIQTNLGIDQAMLAKYIAEWCRALDDDHFVVRDAATRLLKLAAPLAVPELRQLLKEGSPEQIARARAILTSIGEYDSPNMTKPTAVSPATRPAVKPAHPAAVLAP